MLASHSFYRSRRFSLVIAVIVLAIAVASILPNYGTNRWMWQHPATVPHLEQLRQIQQTGLALPGWQTTQQAVREIGGHKWSIQQLVPEATVKLPAPLPVARSPIILMLRPQTWHTDQPQIEWTDINGAQQWTVDHRHRLEVSVQQPAAEPSDDRALSIQARFFRGWDWQQTYAVVQWYAWPTGGSFAPSRWFWADQQRQWQQHHHMPWVAVSLLIPIQPLGDIETARSIAETLTPVIQSSLMVVLKQ